jgi:hypothetical protein
MFRSAQAYMNQALKDCGARAMPRFFLDCWYTLPDLFLQFRTEAFEYPRSDMPATSTLPAQYLQGHVEIFSGLSGGENSTVLVR